MRLLPFLLTLLAPAAFAQSVPLAAEFAAPGTAGYDAAVPMPEAVLGYTVGERHTRPEEVARYFEAVAEASPRVTLGEHGRTYQGRPLIHAFVTAPGRDLDAARRANVRLSAEPDAVGDAELARMPAVAYMGYSVHGNEASGTEAAILLLYHLAAGRGPAVEDVLENVVVLIDPMLNPDGRDRFVDWVNGNRAVVPDLFTTDPQDREHSEPWPNGRTNHYLFDLNRDWLPMQLRESQARMALWHAWRPQLSTDFHEMGGDATYFFQPGIPSRNNPNTPENTYLLTSRIADYHARALDRIGSLYYAGESFDDFYFGKGSTYPDVNGGVGILFEQASSRARAAETINGVLDYGFGVRNQLATSLSSLEAVVAMREDLLHHQRDFYASADAFAREAPVKAYVFDAARYPTRAADLAALLGRHRVRVHRLARPVEAGGERFEPGEALVVPVDQEQGRLVKAMFERTMTFQDSLFYDVSTWTLPLAYGLRHAEVERGPAGLLGPAVEAEMPAGEVVGGRAGYAYVLPWGRYFAPRALHRMQRAGVRARLMLEPFEAAAGGARRTFERGAVVIPVTQPDVEADEVHRLVEEAAREDGVEIFALSTGLTPAGPDFGSRSAPVLERPTVAVVSGAGDGYTSPYGVGEAWFVLAERAGIPVSLLDLDALARANLDRYTTLVMADGSYGGLGEEAAEKLKGWIREGGVLVTMEAATGWAAEQGLIELEEREAEDDSTRYAYADVAAVRGAQVIGGSIFEAALDTTHPIAFGHPERVPVFKADAEAFDLPDAAGVTVAAFAEEAPMLSGYASDENLDRLAGGAALVAQRQDRGAVVAFAFNPNFRAFWWGTQGLFLNAVLFGGAF